MVISLKKDQSKIRPFIWYWYVINGRKRLSEAEYVTLFINMQKLLTNTWKTMIKIETSNLVIYVIGLNERWTRQKHQEKNCWIKKKTYNYLVDDVSEDKKDRKKIIKNNKLILKHNNWLKVNSTMFLLQNLIRLL